MLPELPGMQRIVSEDSLPRRLSAIPAEAGLDWPLRHSDATVVEFHRHFARRTAELRLDLGG